MYVNIRRNIKSAKNLWIFAMRWTHIHIRILRTELRLKKTIPKINNNIYTQHQNNLLTSFAVRVYLVWRSWKTLFCLHKRRARMLLCDLSDDTERMCVCVYINYMIFAVYLKIHKTTLTLTIHKTIYADFVSLDSFLGKCIRTLVYKHIHMLRKKKHCKLTRARNNGTTTHCETGYFVHDW